ncbi:hypothetical protein H6F43_15910 [Leptolyngbya sp. FACHB-36]|uniref:hypothetical protein n=1 Tax=Leptolyngbya sp. FACHB-36 TaxID=2692808 RepID=UPI001680F571|nr:hypothetical protein [Leptolyngbya sp. FACHB-36]MBD2021665.1 hypothetical protein [Leptolyngbya sp. FACHB-36]
MTGFVLKIGILSLLVSIAIKYGGPYLPISGNTFHALVAVLSPSILLALLLGWRWQRSEKL